MENQKDKPFRRFVLKRTFINLVAILFLSCILTACIGSNPANPTPDVNTPLTRIRIGVIGDLPPYITYDAEKKEVSGFDIELMKTIAKKADIYVEFVTLTAGYPHLLDQVEQCRLDGGISAIPIMDSSISQISFSEPYFTTGQVIVVKEGNIKISGLDSLSGMIVGTQAESLSSIELEKMQGIKSKFYQSYHLAFQDLINGYIDAVVADRPRAWIYEKVKSNNLKIVGDEFARVSYAVGFCKNQTEVLKKVNTALEALKKDGSLDKLIKKWQLTTYGQ